VYVNLAAGHSNLAILAALLVQRTGPRNSWKGWQRGKRNRSYKRCWKKPKLATSRVFECSWIDYRRRAGASQVKLDMPPLKSPTDVLNAIRSLWSAIGEGHFTPDEERVKARNHKR
jgi:hypothetical protein